MSKMNSVVAIYDSHYLAEAAIRELQEGGVDIKSLSIAGKDSYTDEHVVGYYNAGDRMKYWGKMGAAWGGFWGLLFGSAMFAIPGIGPILIAGPLVTWILGGLETAAVVGGVSAIGAGLFSIGIPKDSVIKYDLALKTNKFLLIVHGTPDDVSRATDIISGTRYSCCEVHGEPMAAKAAAVSATPAPVATAVRAASRKRLNEIADKLAVRGQKTEHHYDEEHPIFTK